MKELTVNTLSIESIAASIAQDQKYVDDNGDYQWIIAVEDDVTGEVEQFYHSESVEDIFDELGYDMDEYYKKYGVEDEDEDEDEDDDEEVDEHWKELMEQRRNEAEAAMIDACTDIEDLGNEFFRSVCADLLNQAIKKFI